MAGFFWASESSVCAGLKLYLQQRRLIFRFLLSSETGYGITSDQRVQRSEIAKLISDTISQINSELGASFNWKKITGDDFAQMSHLSHFRIV